MQGEFDLKQKKVIDLDTAEFLGYIKGMDIDIETGKINSVTIPKKGILGAFGGKNTLVLSWDRVVSIGSEYVIISQNDNLADENLQKVKK